MSTKLLLFTGLFGFVQFASAELTGVDVQHGKASWYHEPQRLASGGRFNPNEMTAAHRSLPFGTMVRVTNLRSKRSTIVRINDRGPYRGGRIIDVSRAAARELAMINSGVAPVKLEVLASR